jgi:hypothetical protein
MRVKRGLVAVIGTLALGLAAFAPGTAEVAAQECHPAYGPCLQITTDLNCEDIGWAVVQVYDVYNDPYGLDVLYGPGNGWTCDGVG